MARDWTQEELPPPTDDLRARLQFVADAIKPIKGLQGMDATVREAIAALSALPAGGGAVGEVRWAANIPNTITEVLWRDGVVPPVGTKLYTTQALPGGEPVAWQARFKRSDGRWSDWAHAPSEGEAKEFVREHSAGGGVAECRALYTTPPPDAAEAMRQVHFNGLRGLTPDGSAPPDAAVGDYESWAKQERQREDAKARLGVAVGAQGESTARQFDKTVLEPMRKDATPAAGKGVDDAARRLLADAYKADSLGCADSGRIRHPRAVLTWQEQCAIKAVKAALTRQPVAGDGMVLVPRVMHVAEDTWRAASFIVGSREDGFNDADLFIGEVVLDDGTRLYGLHARSSDYPEEGCITLAEFAAPTDTPADGGEG